MRRGGGLGGVFTAVCGTYTNENQDDTSEETAVQPSTAGSDMAGQGQEWELLVVSASVNRAESWQGVVARGSTAVDSFGDVSRPVSWQAESLIKMIGRPKMTSIKTTVTQRHISQRF